MPSSTNEQALELAIEKHLTRTCLEELKKQGESIIEAVRGDSGYFIGLSDDVRLK